MTDTTELYAFLTKDESYKHVILRKTDGVLNVHRHHPSLVILTYGENCGPNLSCDCTPQIRANSFECKTLHNELHTLVDASYFYHEMGVLVDEFVFSVEDEEEGHRFTFASRFKGRQQYKFDHQRIYVRDLFGVNECVLDNEKRILDEPFLTYAEFISDLAKKHDLGYMSPPK